VCYLGERKLYFCCQRKYGGNNTASKSIIMIRHLCSILLVFITFIPAIAQPNYFRASWNDDPSTTMVIGWSEAIGTLHYGTSDLGQDWEAYPLSASFDDSLRLYGISSYFVNLKGLSPKTDYYGVVRDDAGNVSRRLHFRTMSDNSDDPIAFINGGDTRDAAPIFESCDCIAERRRAFTLLNKVCPDFITFSGDFTNGRKYPGRVNVQRQWRDWFEDWQLTLGENGRLIPIFPSLGNHEGREDTVIFKFFNIKLTSGEEHFALNFGGNLLRIYSLNTERKTEADQISWFENDLKLYSEPGNEVYWKAVQYHKSVAAQGRNYAYQPELEFKDNFVALFQTYGVRLAMEGHSHIFKVSWPAVPTADRTSRQGFERNDSLGTVYIGEGNMGAPFRLVEGGPNNLYPWTRDAGTNFVSFFYIHVNKERMDVRTVMNKNNNNLSFQTCGEQGQPLRADAYTYSAEDGAKNDPVVLISPFGSGQIVTSVRDFMKKDLGKVYPNPAKQTLQVEMISDRPVSAIELYDSFGRLRKQVLRPDASRVQLDVSTLSSGMYIVFIRTPEGVQSFKVLVGN
jgi:hypothetical protein